MRLIRLASSIPFWGWDRGKEIPWRKARILEPKLESRYVRIVRLTRGSPPRLSHLDFWDARPLRRAFLYVVTAAPFLPVTSCNQSKFDCGENDASAKQLEFVLLPTEVRKGSCFRRPLLERFVFSATEIRAFADPSSCCRRPIEMDSELDSQQL